MQDILKNFLTAGEARMPVRECPSDMPGNSSTPMSVNISGGSDDIANMLRMLSGMDNKPAMDMPAPAMDMPAPAMDLPMITKIPGADASTEPQEEYMDSEEMMAGGDDIHAEKNPQDIRVKDAPAYSDEAVDEWDNEPDAEYADHDMMLNKLSGGINKLKKSYKAAQRGDNAMAVESYKDRLWAALNEKKQNLK